MLIIHSGGNLLIILFSRVDDRSLYWDGGSDFRDEKATRTVTQNGGPSENERRKENPKKEYRALNLLIVKFTNINTENSSRTGVNLSELFIVESIVR